MIFIPQIAPPKWNAPGVLDGLSRWLTTSGATQTAMAKVLGITQARLSDIKHRKISQFSLDLLVRMAAHAGLHPRLKLAA